MSLLVAKPSVLTLFSSVTHRGILCGLYKVKSYATEPATTSPSDKQIALTKQALELSEDTSKKYTEYVNEVTDRWAKSSDIYYGNERDKVNFPPWKMPEHHPKVRLGFIPDSWFQQFYSKTGVTGPYLFFFGGSMFLLQKEFVVMDPHFMEVPLFVGVTLFFVKYLGPKVADYFDKMVKAKEETLYREPLQRIRSQLDATAKSADVEIARTDGVKQMIEAKRENVNLQLESAYRDRLQQIHRTVKRRLDFHVERENTRRRFQQHHMVNWIVDSVVKGITPQQEKETISQCIADLKRIAAQKSKVATA